MNLIAQHRERVTEFNKDTTAAIYKPDFLLVSNLHELLTNASAFPVYSVLYFD